MPPNVIGARSDFFCAAPSGIIYPITLRNWHEVFMGKMAIRLKRTFDRAIQKKVISLEAMTQAKQQAAENIKTMPSIDQLVKDGRDPLHAIYTNTLNLISLFGEQMTTLPPLHPIHDFMSKWNDTYCPSSPPMSPISNSFFTCWIYLDAAFGEDKETVATCFLSLIDRLNLHPTQVEAAKNLSQSRMGIYEILATQGQFFDLRELITDKKLTAYICSGYIGNAGDIIFVRLVPPLANTAEYFVGLTTPYQLVMQSTDDWLRYFNRHEIEANAVGAETRLHRHMKYGKNRTYWSEYIFYGYSNYAPGVILMTGFPDQPETQPHHEKYQDPQILFSGLRQGIPTTVRYAKGVKRNG
jgi:hypothetical protein